ncbi:hypothetical protein BJ912DRAFT_860927 [Pholiota molesta]|nr:hypothetical protein BJ912DRAFT_860927 [Pholiota molesta]
MFDFTISVIDLYTLIPSIHVSLPANSTAPIAMMRQGYLPATPVNPSLGVSVQTLDLFRRLCSRKASLSVEAYAKVLCDLYNIPYKRRYRKAISDAFDVYLTILRAVNVQVADILGRNSPNWRVLNACPACTYELKEEPYLKYQRLFAMDGNNSLKRIHTIGSRSIADQRAFDSDYFLSPDYVDGFANDVKRRVVPPDASEDADETHVQKEQDISMEGDPTDGAGDTDRPCADNWKASKADGEQRMWGIFLETGIFAAACRHGFFLWIADMLKSGELAKYPLAITAKALETMGDRLLIGYDIGCSFSATLKSSSLADCFRMSASKCCPNAFHGYSHNYLCQARNHPNIIEGIGLEDLEVMECVFSASNQLASVTRYASAYRRRLLIDQYVRQWDAEKYENLATFLYNNYKQALKIIREDSIAFEHAMQALEIDSTEQLEAWRLEELKYLETLGKEDDYDVMAVAYVERLDEYNELKYENASTSFQATFLVSTPTEYGDSTANPSLMYSSDLSKTRLLETERRYADERRASIHRELVEMEVKMEITTRWHASMPEYIEARQYMSRRKYEKAVDALQKLVVQRLFELQRMNQSQNGYQMRTHIAKALQRRSKAIQRAVKAYNVAALELSPAKPTIDWNKVSHYQFLDEFPLLRNTSQDLTGKRWATAAVRETMKQYHRICRAREELTRCNVEIRRLHTSIVDEAVLFRELLAQFDSLSNPIVGAVKDEIVLRTRINENLLEKLSQIYSLEGYSGNPTPGTRTTRGKFIFLLFLFLRILMFYFTFQTHMRMRWI